MKICWILILGLVFFSCQHLEEVKEPENLISEDTMVLVLTDLSILNSAKNYNRRLLEETGIQPDRYLYKKYNIDSLQFEQSTEYYAKNYTEYEKVYEKVKKNLAAMKDKYQKLKDDKEENNRIDLKKRKTTKDTLGYHKVRIES